MAFQHLAIFSSRQLAALCQKKKALTLAILSEQKIPDKRCVRYIAHAVGPLLCGINIDYSTVSVLDVFPVDLTLQQVALSFMLHEISSFNLTNLCFFCAVLEGRYTCTSTSSRSPRRVGITSRYLTSNNRKKLPLQAESMNNNKKKLHPTQQEKKNHI